MLTLQHLTYLQPDKHLLFEDVNLTLGAQDKIALTGNNGTGKSTLLKLIAGELRPAAGLIQTDSKPYYVPQLFGQYNDLTVARALQVDEKVNALHAILAGEVTEENLLLLNDDWTIEDRCQQALAEWHLSGVSLFQEMNSLSGGQKTKVFLSGIHIHQPAIVLLDEPSNHLDFSGRQQLYDLIRKSSAAMIVVSHDRKLLSLLNTVCEVSDRGLTIYGGNSDFYSEQKSIETNALNQDVKSKEKALRKAKEVERETIERQQKLDARGKKKQEKAGVPTIFMNTLRNSAEKSTSRIKDVHAEKVSGIAQDLDALRKALPDVDKMKFGFDNSSLHKGKMLFTAQHINFGYDEHELWGSPLNIEIVSGERIALTGSNGSGKTTLIKILLGEIEPATGNVYRAQNRSVYIDQDYSLIDDSLTVYEQAQQYNLLAFQEHEVKIRLNRFLFTSEFWDKHCRALSGGEKMRLMLCCLTIATQAPDMIVLDEPTNNLDIQNIEILTSAVNDYEGTLIVVSHDEYFLKQINVQRIINLP